MLYWTSSLEVWVAVNTSLQLVSTVAHWVVNELLLSPTIQHLALVVAVRSVRDRYSMLLESLHDLFVTL